MTYKEAKKILTQIRTSAYDKHAAECNIALLISVLAGKLEMSNPKEYEVFIKVWLNALDGEV